MKKNLFFFLVAGLTLLTAACGADKKAKPKMLKKPDLTGFSYYAIDSGMTVTLQFKDKLELDSMRIEFALVTSNETGQGATIAETVKTSGKKLDIRFDRSYFKDEAFYIAMVAGEFQYPVKIFRIKASPVKGEIVLENSAKKVHESSRGIYIGQRVEKKPDGYQFTSIFEKPEIKNYKLKYYPSN